MDGGVDDHPPRCTRLIEHLPVPPRFSLPGNLVAGVEIARRKTWDVGSLSKVQEGEGQVGVREMLSVLFALMMVFSVEYEEGSK